MVDFLMISTRPGKRNTIEIYPKFIIGKSSDLMIRGGDFYAIWIEEKKLWSMEEQDAIQLIDRELDKFASENKDKFDSKIHVLHMWDAETGMIDSWHKYCQKQSRDHFHMLDEKIIFANYETSKNDYASRKLSYPLEDGDITAYSKLANTLFEPDELAKLEWAIGSIIHGDSKKIQKFIVLYGSAGTGKSTMLNIIQMLFEGYYSVFDAKALGSASNSFALEAFKSNPLVAIQHDGDLSNITDNTRLNSLVSHELMTVNEKFRSAYSNRFKCFVFMGTNKPVKITDSRSGLIRRLIDVSPSGEKVPKKEYVLLTKQVEFELGAIATHCLNVYRLDPSKYDDYIPLSMLGASNDFYNFMLDSYYIFKKDDGVTLKVAWEMYKTYCEEAKVSFPYPQRAFKEELKNYFDDYKERLNLDDGSRVRSYYSGFKYKKFENSYDKKEDQPELPFRISFDSTISVFDSLCSNCPAQYANENETPLSKWSEVTSKLLDIDTHKLHYVKLPENHIVIDFDIPDESGAKSFKKNLEAASKWPLTYSELSKSGSGIHLHYIYSGDPTLLSRVYDDHIEIKVFTGNSALRRKLSKCSTSPIATISSGLPLKGEKNVLNLKSVENEKMLRALIAKSLAKEVHQGTKPNMDFIYKLLEDAYNNGITYDVNDLYNKILIFAANSSHNSDYCLKLMKKMKFSSEKPSDPIKNEDKELVFYDVEVFPNLTLVNWKIQGKGKPIVRMFNPKPADIELLLSMRLVGFNCRRYDNHILYALLIGYTTEQVYDLSQKIISGKPNCFFGEAYNISYTDVYDFSSTKQSLKKFEISLGLHHQELGLKWDEPVPEELWKTVAEYCDNDVLATEAVFEARKSDFTARQILADIAGLTVNDTTNTLTTKIIFGGNKNPQSKFNYRNMGDTSEDSYRFTFTNDNRVYDHFGDEYTVFNENGKPIFPGYIYDAGKSTYRGEEVGEGGYVYSSPGCYGNVALLDVASMHPTSIVTENLFGDEYTLRFKEILEARIAIKHKDFEKAKGMLNGALSKYLNDPSVAKDLATALKIAINSVYGLTSASFENPFRDPRNKDNIVAKRGALFMINLRHEVEDRGFTVAHIKTDSIKIPDATPEIIKFICEYGHQYGYTFEHEATYDRMCLVNDAVYIARYARKDKCQKLYGYIPDQNKDHEFQWTATGTQFAVPYVFKTLFSKEDILFEDMCETKSVSSSIYLDLNENLGENEHRYHFVGKVGLFCPIKDGCGGAILLRESISKTGEVKYAAVTGSKGYRWLESEMVRILNKEDCINRQYYDDLVNDAVNNLSQFMDFEWFISDSEYKIEDKNVFIVDQPL